MFSGVAGAAHRMQMYSPVFRVLRGFPESPLTPLLPCSLHTYTSIRKEEHGCSRREDKPGAEGTHGTGQEVTAPAGHSPTAPGQGRMATATGPAGSPGITRPHKATSQSQGQMRLDEQGVHGCTCGRASARTGDSLDWKGGS